MSPRPMAGAAEQIKVRPVGDGFAYVSLVCNGWSVSGIRVRADGESGCRIEWPSTESGGRRYPVVTPPPGLRERLKTEIVAAFARATGRRAAA